MVKDINKKEYLVLDFRFECECPASPKSGCIEILLYICLVAEFRVSAKTATQIKIKLGQHCSYTGIISRDCVLISSSNFYFTPATVQNSLNYLFNLIQLVIQRFYN